MEITGVHKLNSEKSVDQFCRAKHDINIIIQEARY